MEPTIVANVVRARDYPRDRKGNLSRPKLLQEIALQMRALKLKREENKFFICTKEYVFGGRKLLLKERVNTWWYKSGDTYLLQPIVNGTPLLASADLAMLAGTDLQSVEDILVSLERIVEQGELASYLGNALLKDSEEETK